MKKLLCILMAFGLSGGEVYLALLQGMAWTGMVVTYSMDQGLRRGITDTFSGDAPCAMCCAVKIERSKSVPETSFSVPAFQPIVAVIHTFDRCLHARSAERLRTATDPCALTRDPNPPVTPPPRLA